jgi:hypothetical protein
VSKVTGSGVAVAVGVGGTAVSVGGAAVGGGGKGVAVAVAAVVAVAWAAAADAAVGEETAVGTAGPSSPPHPASAAAIINSKTVNFLCIKAPYAASHVVAWSCSRLVINLVIW